MDEFEYKDYLEQKRDSIRTGEDLIKFIDDEIINYPDHNYGTIVRGMAQAMLAAMSYVNQSKIGGISAFQASCLGHELIPPLMMVKPPYTVLQWSNLLYPQYDAYFTTIPKNAWQEVQKQAQKLLEAAYNNRPDIKEHLRSITEGNVPFGLKVRED